ncbi:MAG: helix-turn-helix domain-containing protein [Clostridia bacterium]|nr:helix-turn-helix domain-containing protein [Clostridia bacterium]
MIETMGQIIRRLRKERNLTQEELAEQLNITSQAVSRWENGTGMPDISQIVPLSNVFGVTTDVLFSKDGMDGEEEVTAFIREAERKINNKPTEGISRFAHRKMCCDEVQAMVGVYPNNYALLCCSLADIVFLLWDYTEEQFADEITDKESEMKAWANEGIRQGNIVLNYCTDSYLLNIANRWLVSIYRIMKDYSKAEEHARKLTDGRETFLAIVYDDMGRTEDAMKQYSVSIDNAFSALIQSLPLLGYLYLKQKKFDEAYTCYRLFPDIYDLMFKNSEDEVPYYAYHPCFDWCAAVCMKLGRHDEAMDWLEKWLKHEQINAKNYNVITESKLPYFSGLIFADSYHESYLRENRITPSLEWDNFDPIRETDRFKAILADAEAFEKGD